MTQINMTVFGLSERFTVLTTEYPNLIIGRILSQEKGLYRVISAKGEQFAKTSGRFRYETVSVLDFPVVGDFVMIDCTRNLGDTIIHHVLPRKSVFIRKAAGTAHKEQAIAANIDTVFICMSLNSDFNLRRLERYISICWDSETVPIVVLTKADLCENTDERLSAVQAVAIGVDIITTSAIELDGYEQVLPYIKEGHTIALIGSSGVGKSTLINRLLGENRIDTNGLRNDDKGRHTTTRRELFLLPNGGLVIDTPGMRELGLWNAAEGLDKTFSDIEELSTRCRFNNCSHATEPGCAVTAAIKNGDVSSERWQSYQKLKTENAYAEDSESYLMAKEHRHKNISKIIKAEKAKGNIRR